MILRHLKILTFTFFCLNLFQNSCLAATAKQSSTANLTSTSKTFQFENSESFKNQITSVLNTAEYPVVEIDFMPAQSKLPPVIERLIGESTSKTAGLTLCDTNSSQMSFSNIIDGIKPGEDKIIAKKYSIIVEFNSSSAEIKRIIYVRSDVLSVDIKKRYSKCVNSDAKYGKINLSTRDSVSITESISDFDSFSAYSVAAKSVGRIVIDRRRCVAGTVETDSSGFFISGDCDAKILTEKCTATFIIDKKPQIKLQDIKIMQLNDDGPIVWSQLNVERHSDQPAFLTNEHCVHFQSPSDEQKYWFVEPKYFEIDLRADEIKELAADLASNESREFCKDANPKCSYYEIVGNSLRIPASSMNDVSTSGCGGDHLKDFGCGDWAIVNLAPNFTLPAHHLVRIENNWYDIPKFLRLSSMYMRAPRDGERLFMLHYPGGADMMVSHTGGCRVDAAGRLNVANGQFSHRCWTEKGSSGALLFAESDGALIGIHHDGYSVYDSPDKFPTATIVYNIFSDASVRTRVNPSTLISLKSIYNEIIREPTLEYMSAPLSARICMIAESWPDMLFYSLNGVGFLRESLDFADSLDADFLDKMIFPAMQEYVKMGGLYGFDVNFDVVGLYRQQSAPASLDHQKYLAASRASLVRKRLLQLGVNGGQISQSVEDYDLKKSAAMVGPNTLDIGVVEVRVQLDRPLSRTAFAQECRNQKAAFSESMH